MEILDDLENYEKKVDEEGKIRNKIETILYNELDEADREKGYPKIILDTFIEKMSNKFSISRYNSEKHVKQILREFKVYESDGTYIMFSPEVPRMLKCVRCGCRYSIMVRKCPTCG